MIGSIVVLIEPSAVWMLFIAALSNVVLSASATSALFALNGIYNGTLSRTCVLVYESGAYADWGSGGNTM